MNRGMRMKQKWLANLGVVLSSLYMMASPLQGHAQTVTQTVPLTVAPAGATTVTKTHPTPSAKHIYPDRPIKLVVPYAAGGATDVMARLITPKLSAALGQSVVVENRPGAATVIGTALVAAAPADGYTILQGSAALAITPSTMKKIPYDVERDLIPVIQTSAQAYAILVRADSPFRSLEDLIVYARRYPKKLSFGTPGFGSSGHMSTELFASEAGIEMTSIAYKGDNPVITDLLGGHIDLSFVTISAATPHLKSGQLRALAITSIERSPRMPDTPTVAESGIPHFEATSWNGILVAAGTPPEIVKRLETEIAITLKSAELQQWYLENSATPGAQNAQAFGEMIRQSMKKWAVLAQKIGISPE